MSLLVSPTSPPEVCATAPAEWTAAIARVIDDDSPVTTVFQPIVDLYRGCTAGYEALLRFHGVADAGPADWLREAAARNRGVELERRCLLSALAALPQLPPNTFLSLNVSPELLASSEWEDILTAHARLDRVVVEVTEHAVIDDYNGARRALQHARQRGALCAIDDTGSGYASMQHVVTLRPDFVKIDRLFIANCGKDPAKAALIEALGGLAANLDAWIVAEGVECDEELECLLRLGVPLAQGFLLARPDREWSEPGESAQTTIRSYRRRAADTGHLSGLLEPGHTTRVRTGPVPLVLTVVLDEHQRPVRWLGGGRPRLDGRLLVANVTTPVKAAARRAMVRSEPDRFLPIVCTDNEGRYAGIVRIERLIEFLSA